MPAQQKVSGASPDGAGGPAQADVLLQSALQEGGATPVLAARRPGVVGQQARRLPRDRVVPAAAASRRHVGEQLQAQLPVAGAGEARQGDAGGCGPDGLRGGPPRARRAFEPPVAPEAAVVQVFQIEAMRLRRYRTYLEVGGLSTGNRGG